jgi:DNA repair exonuclease SbcCD ATPase subunit
MMSNADRSRNNLLKILDKMFLIVTIDSKPKITIHPTLTSDILDSLVNQTRDQILQLYVGCERDFYMGMKLLRVIVEEKMQENLEASLVKLKIDTRSSIKKVIEQKHQNVAASEQSGMFSQIKNAVFSSKPYDVSDDEDKIKKDTDKQKGIDAATEEENSAKEQLVILTKLIKDKTDEIENTRQMKAVIEKKREQAREVLRKAKDVLASNEADQKTKGGVEGSSKELNETVIKVRHDVDTAEIELKSADEEFANTEKKIEELNNSSDEIKRNITDKQKQLEELTKKKTDLLLLKP